MKTIIAFVIAVTAAAFSVPAVSAVSAGLPDAPVSQKFASVSVGHYVAADSPEAKRAARSLPVAAKHFNLSESRVFDIVDAGRRQAVKDGVNYNMLEVLEALPSMDPRERSDADQLANIIALYDVDREQGMSHTDTVIGIRNLLRDLK